MDNNNDITNELNASNTAWDAGATMTTQTTKPRFKNLKEEVLQNKFASISKRCWNDTLRKCQAIYKGQIQSSTKKEWSKKLKDYNIGLKELIALKLYCDFDDLQREFRKCFRAPFNQNNDRLSSFYWWNKILTGAFRAFNQVECEHNYTSLFHGVSSVMCIDKIDGKFHGPLSTTTDIKVARSFAGKAGMILVLQPVYGQENGYQPFDISNLSEFPDEHEVLCFDQSYTMKNVILSLEFDDNFHYYNSKYSNTGVKETCSSTAVHIGEPDHEMDGQDLDSECKNEALSDDGSNAIVRKLHELSEEIINNDGYVCMECIIQFLLEFVTEYRENKLPSDFDVFVDSQIKYMVRDSDRFAISTKMLQEIVNSKSCNIRIDEIKGAFIEYFDSINVKFIN